MRWRLSDLSIRYPAGGGDIIDALSDISLVIEKGERLAVVGANGSGKSTLAQTLAGLLEPTSGRITVERDDVAPAGGRGDGDSMAALVFQGPDDNLIAETVREEIMLALEFSRSRGSNLDLAERWLADFGLENLRDRPVQKLSGGEKQKLAIACAFASGRELIVLDEPTSHLDPPGRRDLLARLFSLSKRGDSPAGGNPAVVLITQYPADALRFPRIVVLEAGRVVLDGPAHAWCRPTRAIAGDITSGSANPDAPVIVTTERLSQVAQQGWPLPCAPLADISVQIRAGDAIGLCGPIGSGKSTLGYHLAGLFKSNAGKLETAWARRPKESPALMIQFPERQLFCPTVGEDVAFGPSARGTAHDEAVKRASSILDALGLPPSEFTDRSPFDLSAGQQRRVGMAGVAACTAPLYILDEPTAALDFDGLGRLESLLAQWHSAGIAYLVISHDLEWLSRVTSRVWVMNAGRILFDGAWSNTAQLDPVLESIGFKDDR